jgi:hypothetical protein
MLFSGYADVCEWYDETINKYCISVEVANKTWGKLFGYSGTFDAVFKEIESISDIPSHVKPIREEIRE